MNPEFILRISPKGKKFYHEVIETATGKLIGDRTSNRRYSYVTVVRQSLRRHVESLEHNIRYYSGQGDMGRFEKATAELREIEAQIAAGEVFGAAGVYSYNSKPTSQKHYPWERIVSAS